MDTKLEKSLLEVISHISNHFGPKAVLRGGMALRLQGIERNTLDADFCFQPYKSKKEFCDELVSVMDQICDKPVTLLMDSKRLKIDGVYHGADVIVEANAHSKFEPLAISTSRLARRYGFQPSIISVMPNVRAFADKLGAWLERRLMRDLYDIYIFIEVLRVRADSTLLLERILNPSYAKGIKSKPKLESVASFLLFLKSECDELTPERIESELKAIVSSDQLGGLGKEILVCIRRSRHL